MTNEPTLLTRPGKDERVLKRLVKLAAQRKYHEWRLRDVDGKMTVAARELAQARGVAFLRPEAVEHEITAFVAEQEAKAKAE